MVVREKGGEDLQIRKFLCMVFSCLIAVSCFCFNAKAAGVEVCEMYSGIERASGRFSVDIPGERDRLKFRVNDRLRQYKKVRLSQEWE